jgi:hypothetical protein
VSDDGFGPPDLLLTRCWKPDLFLKQAVFIIQKNQQQRSFVLQIKRRHDNVASAGKDYLE